MASSRAWLKADILPHSLLSQFLATLMSFQWYGDISENLHFMGKEDWPDKRYTTLLWCFQGAALHRHEAPAERLGVCWVSVKHVCRRIRSKVCAWVGVWHVWTSAKAHEARPNDEALLALHALSLRKQTYPSLHRKCKLLSKQEGTQPQELKRFHTQ